MYRNIIFFIAPLAMIAACISIIVFLSRTNNTFINSNSVADDTSNLEVHSYYSGAKIIKGKTSIIRSTVDDSFLTDVYTDKKSNKTKVILIDIDSLIYDTIELDDELNTSNENGMISIDQINKKVKTVKSVYEELEYYVMIDDNTKYILVKNGNKIYKNKFRNNDYDLNKFLK